MGAQRKEVLSGPPILRTDTLESCSRVRIDMAVLVKMRHARHGFSISSRQQKKSNRITWSLTGTWSMRFFPRYFLVPFS